MHRKNGNKGLLEWLVEKNASLMYIWIRFVQNLQNFLVELVVFLTIGWSSDYAEFSAIDVILPKFADWKIA